jgi:hypothetical protein
MATKLIKSVSLLNGESFVLPPGAVLKGSSNNSFTSTCDLPTLETLSCYVAIVGGGGDSGDGVHAIFEAGNSHLTGVRFNKVETAFTTGYDANNDGQFDLISVSAEVKAKVNGIVATAYGYRGDLDGGGSGERGSLNYILIQTIPSIADNLELLFQGSMPVAGIGATTATSRVPFIRRDLLVTAGWEALPDCPTVDAP